MIKGGGFLGKQEYKRIICFLISGDNWTFNGQLTQWSTSYISLNIFIFPGLKYSFLCFFD